MGNQVFAGAPFAEVAKVGSDGVEAADGGRRDWTTKGSLACEELDRALFGLPVGTLSPIIEGPNGFHIIRVTQREEPVVTPFLDTQKDIREKIVKERSEKQLREYLAKLEAHTPVWTVFDGPTEVANRPQQSPMR
jgi:foldase protein PrsA